MLSKNKNEGEMSIQAMTNFVKGAFENVQKSVCDFIVKNNEEQRTIIKE